jgi:hypothetical protein
LDEIERQLGPLRGYAVGLWRGYVFRNLGIVFGQLGEKNAPLSMKYLKHALDHRKRALADFETENIDPHILEQIKLELLLVKMDLLRHPRRKRRDRDLEDLVLDLKVSRPKDRTRGIWHLLLVEAAHAAKSFRNKTISGPLDDILQTEFAEYRKKGDQLSELDQHF